jgi:hypothetical protein
MSSLVFPGGCSHIAAPVSSPIRHVEYDIQSKYQSKYNTHTAATYMIIIPAACDVVATMTIGLWTS